MALRREAEQLDARHRAQGVLVALKRCTLDAAAGEIARAWDRHRLDSDRVARALVRLAQDIEARYGRAASAEEVSMIRRFAAWIRKGYPTSAPEHGHCYLLALRGVDRAVR